MLLLEKAMQRHAKTLKVATLLPIVSFVTVSALNLWHNPQAFAADLPANRVATTGLSTSDWAAIGAARDVDKHWVREVGNVLRAHNPRQQWHTDFDGRGFTTIPESCGWSWGLELVSYGTASREFSVSKPVCVEAADQRVVYRWNAALTEWFINDARGLEHGFTIHQRPDDSPGALVLALFVRGDLRPHIIDAGRIVGFTDGANKEVVSYSGLTVVDAVGRHLQARFETTLIGLRLSIDDTDAQYPITVDPIAQQTYVKASNTDIADQFGIAVAISGDTVVIGAIDEDGSSIGVNGNQHDNTANGAGAAYVFVCTGGIWSQQAYLKASNTETDDGFGGAVAISGDTIVVGAIGEDSDATGVNGNEANNAALGSGAAYVFIRSGSTWTQQAYLKASNTGANDAFGTTVAISGDTIAVSAIGEDSNATGINGNQSSNTAGSSGAVYVFTRNGTVWTQEAYIKASNTNSADIFGTSIALSGDSLIVGAENEDSSATGINGNQSDNSESLAGAAYVFVRSSGAWSQQAYIKASNTDNNDRFGSSVAISGDTAVVGARLESSNATGVNGNEGNNSASSSGAAYVFVRNGVTWSQQAYLKASNTGAQDWFGSAVAMNGDLVAVGAFQEDSNATGTNGDESNNDSTNSGAVYIFGRSGSSWTQAAYVKASNTGIDDQFGKAVAVSVDAVIVGAWLEDSIATGINGNQNNETGNAAGAAYIFAGICTPLMSLQPVDSIVCAGDLVTFSIGASGIGISYQWRKDGFDLVDGGAINGATTSMLTIDPVTSGDAGEYDCVISNSCNSATSDVAMLIVNEAPAVTMQPVDQSVNIGGSAQFSVVVTGSAPLSYQWRRGTTPITNGATISGATSSTLTINPVSLYDDGDDYNCLITNSCGSDVTLNVMLTVNLPMCVGDLDGDLDVDLTDLSLLLAHFGEICSGD